ncbi:hypothetical protein [Ferrovibrio sp.]|uniref:hypothetical protein n=1 Tax=Ferrovibrio sp. TaxID=1917215 RepID=UPI00311D4324
MNAIIETDAAPALPSDELSRILHAEDGSGRWLPPAVVTDQMRLASRAVLADMGKRMAMADRGSILKWLVSLGTLSAGRMSLEEARTRATGYADLLSDDFEAGCFTRGSLKRVAARYTWFPSFAEVTEALMVEKRRLWKERERLKRLANPPPARQERKPPTPEQRARVQAVLDEFLGRPSVAASPTAQPDKAEE